MPWLFFENESGCWRWAHVADDGSTKAESQCTFATRLECVADAKRSGFGAHSERDCDRMHPS